MLISVSKNREYVCKINDGVDAVFRYPTASESLKLAHVSQYGNTSDMADFIASMFERFNGKVEAKDESGDVFEIKTMAELLRLGGEDVMGLVIKCLNGYREAIQNGANIEKKQK